MRLTASNHLSPLVLCLGIDCPQSSHLKERSAVAGAHRRSVIQTSFQRQKVERRLSHTSQKPRDKKVLPARCSSYAAVDSALEREWGEGAAVLHIGAQWGTGGVFNWRHGSVGRLQFSGDLVKNQKDVLP